MELLEFMERLAALVPRPRLHLIRFCGVLAPNAKFLRQITPSPIGRATGASSENTLARRARWRCELIYSRQFEEPKPPANVNRRLRSLEFRGSGAIGNLSGA